MKNRRNFIKTGIMVSMGVLTAGSLPAGNRDGGIFDFTPKGLIYTKEQPGMWKNKAESHVPKVSIEGRKIKLTTEHGMSEAHYIVRHTLVTGEGKVIGGKTFTPADEPVSVYEIPEGYHGTLYATSFCNKHDFWVNIFEI